MLKDILVPTAVMAVIASMILPLPPYIVDFLLVGNLVLALTLLISTLYISDPLKLSALPTILLLATLYRLSLNISTTRLILSTGDAGRTIEAFGSVVINGNLIVGLVVFLVITLVQFIVIAKGSERVAEVSARFTLDALPGKQMSLDADIRSGHLDLDTAKKKRDELQVESRFYGALDGAMKFIKGDAIAGIVITAVNLLGGLSVGFLVEGLGASEVLNKYTLLTIGDGLLSQVPALLNSLAAGMVVTRVAKLDGESLSSELLRQVGQVKQVRILIGMLSIILAFVPAMPAAPFIVLGTLLLISTLFVKEQKSDSSTSRDHFIPKSPALLSVSLRSEFKELAYQDARLGLAFEQIREYAFKRYGLIILPPEFKFEDNLEVMIRAEYRGIDLRDYDSELSKDNFKNVVVELVCSLIDTYAEEVVDDILTRRTLDFLEKEAPELVASIIPGVVTVTQLTFLLRALLEEGISIKNFDRIVQAVAEAGPKTKTDRELLEEVRIKLGNIICRTLNIRENRLNGVVLEPVLDMAIAQAERRGEAINLSWIELIAEALEKVESDQRLLVCSKKARRLIFDCLKLQKVVANVIAYDEIPLQLDFEKIGEVSLKDEDVSDELIESLAA